MGKSNLLQILAGNTSYPHQYVHIPWKLLFSLFLQFLCSETKLPSVALLMVAADPCCDCYWTILWFFELVHQWFSLSCSLMRASLNSQQQAETYLHNPINIHGQAGPLTVTHLFQTQFTKVRVSGCWVQSI